MTSRFLALKVRPANIQLRNNANRNGEEIPVCWLLCEWPAGKDEPTKYWLSNLPPDTPLKTLVKLAKLRWRIEHDYRELKDALGPRPLRGPHLPRLAPPRHPRLHRARIPHPGANPAPSSQGGSLTLFAGPPGATNAPGLLARHLPHLPQRAAARPPTTPTTNLTEHY